MLASGNAGRGYRPLPVQQASTGQMGTVPPDCPGISQQQHPLQSIHDETCGSGPQEHAAPSGEVGPASIDPPSVPPSIIPPELLLDELLPEELLLLDEPLLDELLLPPLLLDDRPPEELELLVVPLLEDVVPEEPPPEDPLLEDPLPPPLSPLLQATNPTVEDAPATTSTWKSFSIFMGLEPRPAREWGKPIVLAQRS